MKYPIDVYRNKNKLSHFQYKSFKIAINDIYRCALLNDFVIFILDVLEEKDILYFRVQQILNPKSFTAPCSLERLSIFVISKTTTYNIITGAVTQIKRKCLIIKNIDEIDFYITISLLHINN